MADPARSTESGLPAVLRVLRRRWTVVAAAFLLVVGGAVGISLLAHKRYTATASLLFRDPGLDQKLFGSTFFLPNADPASDRATNVTLVSLEEVAHRAARALGGKYKASDLRDKISISAQGQSNVVSIEATDASPQTSARIANAFAGQYVAFRRSADRDKIAQAEALVARQLAATSPADRRSSDGRDLGKSLQQLRVLAALQTGNAELVQPALVPTSPSWPRPLRNAALGVLVGLLLGVGLAVLAERLDQRFSDPDEVERQFSRPTLAAIPASRVLSQQAGDRLQGVEAEAFHMLRANLRYFNVKTRVRSVLLTSAAAGDGKSTVAWHLALAAADTGSNVLLLEADLRRPTLAKSHKLPGYPGLSDFLAGAVSLDAVVREIATGSPRDTELMRQTVHVLPAGSIPPNPIDLLDSEKMRDLVQELEEQYDLVIIDSSPPSFVSDAIPLLQQVSGVIVVVRFSRTTRRAANQLHGQLKNLRAPVLGLVVNDVPIRRGYAYGYHYGYSPESQSPTAERQPESEGVPAS